MTTANVKREGYFIRFRKRWKRRGVVEIDEAHPKHKFTMYIRQGLQQSIQNASEESEHAGRQTQDPTSLMPYYRESVNDWTTSTTDKAEFLFVTYAPRVFEYIREQVGMTPEIYSECISPAAIETKYLEFVSNSKSGQNFFLSNDKQLMIKTHTKSEKEFFMKILPKYIEHLKQYPHSLMVRYLGLYKIMLNRFEPIYFVVMQSILYPDERINLRYDLKACEAGRYTEDKTEPSEVVTVLKDKNFGERKIHLGSQSSWFRLQIEHDTEFLRKLHVIDYSLLVGVQPLHLDEIRENQELASIVVRTKKSTSREHSILRRWASASPKKVMAQISEDSVMSPELPDTEPQEQVTLPGSVDQESPTHNTSSNIPEQPTTSCGNGPVGTHKDNGTRTSVSEFESSAQNRRLLPNYRNELHVIDGENQERYFIGIIDFFTPYGVKKRCESLYKAMKYRKSKTSFSTVNPNAYAERFREFVSSHVA